MEFPKCFVSCQPTLPLRCQLKFPTIQWQSWSILLFLILQHRKWDHEQWCLFLEHFKVVLWTSSHFGEVGSNARRLKFYETKFNFRSVSKSKSAYPSSKQFFGPLQAQGLFQIDGHKLIWEWEWESLMSHSVIGCAYILNNRTTVVVQNIRSNIGQQYTEDRNKLTKQKSTICTIIKKRL